MRALLATASLPVRRARCGGITAAARRHFSESSGEKRLHSTDIAFKPTEGGWGYNNSFASGYDRIFGGGKKSAAEAAPEVKFTVQEKLEALKAARECEALTSEEYESAVARARQQQ
mmetsp:Transcript_19999/g.67243  ORF Transcript_19999/g.67243 Transcript_19999/m.67243 type:complete len:116 (-) Transcript_19999:255-602(-)